MRMLLLPLLTGAVLVYLYRSRRLAGRWFLLLLAGAVVCTGEIGYEIRTGEKEEIVALPYDAGGPLHDPVPLLVERGEEAAKEVQIRVPAILRSKEEVRTLLEAQAKELETQILGRNTSCSRIEWNLSLPASLAEGQIAVIWTSDRPEILSAQGTIGQAAAPEGSEVLLSAVLTMEEEKVEWQRTLLVFPSKETSVVAERLQQETDRINAGRSEDRNEDVQLPSALDGKALTWYREKSGAGRKGCALLLLIALLLVLSKTQKEEEQKKKRKQELLRSYPALLSKTHLLLTSGLSLRKAIERLAADAGKEAARTGKRTAVGEELQRTWYEMENGMLEQDALMQFGERCGTAEYKGFALLLAQNQIRGGYTLLPVLVTEVQQAFEERKRRARIAGEKAAIRLAVPMGMMLVVVLILILVPALLSF